MKMNLKIHYNYTKLILAQLHFSGKHSITCRFSVPTFENIFERLKFKRIAKMIEIS